MDILQQIKDIWGVVVSIGVGLAGAVGWWIRTRSGSRTLRKEATAIAREAQITVANLTEQLIDKDIESAALYRALINITTKCGDCAAEDVAALPKHIRQKIQG